MICRSEIGASEARHINVSTASSEGERRDSSLYSPRTTEANSKISSRVRGEEGIVESDILRCDKAGFRVFEQGRICSFHFF